MSSVHKFRGAQTNFDWENAILKEYAEGAARGASGKIMIGRDDGAEHFVFRYFRIEPGGHSTLNDYHAHDHGVMVLHGRALLSLGEEQFELGPFDVVYIQPWEYHHLAALGDEPMGFLCVIPNKEMLVKLQELKAPASR
jgi:quercetin dioxygenase-like cupin family protein